MFEKGRDVERGAWGSCFAAPGWEWMRTTYDSDSDSDDSDDISDDSEVK